MIVYEPIVKERETFSTISVDIEWENEHYKRDRDTVLFDIPNKYVPSRCTISSALAIAFSLPALHKCETRIKLSAPVDPVVLSNIRCVLAQHSSWFNYDHKSLTIDAPTAAGSDIPATQSHAGSFFSGGVDSLWTLKRNHATLPIGHPLRIQDIIFVYGLDIGWKSGETGNITLYDETTDLFEEFSNSNNLNSIVIHTNIRHIFDCSNFWATRWHGMVLAAIGYLLSNKITDLFVPAANDLWHPDAWGTSPLVEPALSSHRIHLYHDGVDHTRLDKVKYLVKWSKDLNLLRVCTKTDNIPDGFLNCGECEKCLRTKLELIASGITPESIGSFAVSGIDFERLQTISPYTLYQASEYEELIDPLNALNRTDLTEAIEGIMGRWTKWSEWKNEQTTTGLLKQLIRKFTKSWPPTPDTQPMKVR